ncbi:MAG: penicillin-insensitive murein endopeptidase [Alphaproteobacteria bacterium]
MRYLFRIILLMGAIGASASAAPIAKELFGLIELPSAQAPQSYGSYAKGCLAGAEQLPESGANWQAMRLSRNRNWGHPDTIAFIKRLSRSAERAGWAGLYVGDISQPRGGPMLTGHASHQIGLDADIWMLPATSMNLTVNERENLSSISVVSEDLKSVNANWTVAHHEILMAALKDKSVARIFVSGAIKLQMCEDASPTERRYLRKLRPWWGHTYHFHVRLNCPRGSTDCTEQAPPPAGDGCDSVEWWVTDALLPPDPNAPPKVLKPELVMVDLPSQCLVVLESR